MLRFEVAHDLEQLIAGLVKMDRTSPCRRTWPRSSRSCIPGGSRRKGSAVAAVFPGLSWPLTPMIRVPKPDGMRRDAGSGRSHPRPGIVETSGPPHRGRCGRHRSARPGPAVGDVTADDDGGARQVLADQLAHLRHLADVGDDGADADHVVTCSRDLSVRSARGSGSRAGCRAPSMLAWIIIRPQERWNMRSENGPCTRVTWFW